MIFRGLAMGKKKIGAESKCMNENIQQSIEAVA